MNPRTPPLPGDANEEVSALIEVLHETGQRLEELTAGEVDTVADRQGRTVLLRRAQDHFRQSEAAKQTAILNALPAHIALLDAQGVIISVNETWRGFACVEVMQGPGHEIGLNYLEICANAKGEGSSEAHRIAKGIRSVLAGEARSFSIEYSCHSPTEQRWFLLMATPLAVARPNGAVVMHLNITERKLTEEALAQSDAGLHRAQLMAKLEHVITGPDGSFETWSESLPRLIGVEPVRLPRTTLAWLDLLHPDDRTLFRDKAIEAGVKKLRVDLEYRLRRANGEWIHMRQTMEPLNQADAPGGLRWFNTLQDVTAERQTEESLRVSESRFRQMADNIRDVFWLTDPAKNQILYVSPAYEEIWGRSCESVYASPRDWVDAIHPEDRERVLQAAQTKQASGNYAEEFRIVRPDGATRWIRDRAFPVLRSDGVVYRIAGLAQDITESRRAAEELRESDRRFSDLLANVEMVSMMLDTKAGITYCNDYLLRLTGWRREEVIGRNWIELFIPPSQVDDLRGVFAALLANRPEASHCENEILTRSGERRLIRWNNSLLRSAAGDAVGTASIGEDVTERKMAEEVLKKRAAELERFHRLSVGRELQMIELKKQINELASQTGHNPPYDLAFAVPKS